MAAETVVAEYRAAPVRQTAVPLEYAVPLVRRVTYADMARTKDITLHPGFRGEISRFAWRVWACRFTSAGRYLAFVTVIYLAFEANTMQIQAYMPGVYLMMLWLVTFFFVLISKPRVDITATHVDRIRAGSVLPVDIELVQRRRNLADLCVIPYNLPPGLDASPADGAATGALRAAETAHIHLGIKCTSRGSFTWPGFRVESEFPFGLMRTYRNLPSKHNVLVYPGFTPLIKLNIPVGRRYQPGGVAMSSDLGESFEYIGNRDYRDGDNVRDIDWVATARLNTPIVREYRDEYFLRVGVVLDTFIPPGAKPEAHENFERAVSLCASVSDYMARSDYLVDIFAAGPFLYHLTAGRSLAYLEQILDILACVEHSPEEPFSLVEPELTDYLTRLTTVVCVFMDWDENRRDFVHRLATQGAGVKVIIVRDEECTLVPNSPDAHGLIPIISRSDFERGMREL